MIDARAMLRRMAARAFAALLMAAAAGSAFGQGVILQGGPWTPGHAPMYVGSGSGQAIVQDSGPAGGGGTGLGFSELNVTARGTGTPPYADQGTGPFRTINCTQDAVSTNPTGYHYLCLSANAQGGGLIAYGAIGSATPLPLNLIVNGTTYQFPFALSGIVGPSTTVVGDIPTWNNTTGTLLADSGITSASLARLISGGAATLYADQALGTDSSVCGATSGAGACKTIQVAVNNAYATYSPRRNAVTIQVADTTGTAGALVSGPLMGGGTIIISGNVSTPANVVINGGGATACFQADNYATLAVAYLKVTNCALEIASTNVFTTVYVSNVVFDSCSVGSAGTQMYVSRLAYMEVLGPYTIAGSANCSNHLQASHQGNFRASGAATGPTIATITADLTYTFGVFAYASAMGDITFTGYSLSPFNLDGHTVTAQSWNIDSGGVIQNLVAGTFFPGTTGFMHGIGSYNAGLHAGTTISAGGGSGPVIVGDDYDGVVTEGSGSTGVTLTFGGGAGGTFSGAPSCTISYLTAVTAPIYAITTTTLTTGHDAGAPVFAYHCHGG